MTDAPKSTDPEKILRQFTGASGSALAQKRQLYRAESSLFDFSRLMWKVIEPGQPLRTGWAFGAICEHLEAVHRGQIRNLLINVPPGFTKSTLTNVMFPAWEWGPRDRSDLRILSWSYAEHLTSRDNDKTRTLLEHPLYRALWGDRVQFSKKQNEKRNFKTIREGWKIASTVRGVGTGERGDRLILDDPHSVEGADSDADREMTVSWFGGTMASRVRNANPFSEVIDGIDVQPSATIIIMQRVHRKDVSGVIIDQDLPFEHLLIEMEYEGMRHPRRAAASWRGSSIGWVDPRESLTKAFTKVRESVELSRTASTFRQTTLQTAAGWQEVQDKWTAFVDLWSVISSDICHLADPKRFTRAAVEDLRRRLILKQGTNAVAAQLRQWPSEGEGTLFKREWFKYCEPHEVPVAGRDDCRGWDLAASEALTADRTACVQMRMAADGRIYVLHATAVRVSPAKLDDLIRDTLAADGKTVVQSFPQDPGAAGKMVVNHIARGPAQGYRFRSSPEAGSKDVRAAPFGAQVEHGNVTLVRASWNVELVSELVEFPHGLNDDLVDACSRAYDALVQSRPTVAPAAPKLFVSQPPDLGW